MQATDTATDRDFARKAATAVRWAGKALWFVFGSLVRVLYLAITSLLAIGSALPSAKEETSDYHSSDPGPAPFEPGHNPQRWNDYYQ
ncbi:hypothetical protein [Gilvimarinus chinensis]|uniref:hypothetical protein n=1 Tax=Gilvimarinus chinensis TaxID=396005 RepID=UPI00036BF282|nr:hypothetical protein [Gilvimarinus chinensis]